MAKHKMTKRNASQVLKTIGETIEPDPKGDGKVYLEKLNALLDDLLSEDFFGTEGQLDPRGDQRD
ncbi:hypothetical protein [Corallococcus sp. 4LFB]|uniref:hypothetical protein n=1 Tax=Corallococcus sp. 4LFB TaxID=3383249 RepID=UPI003975830C